MKFVDGAGEAHARAEQAVDVGDVGAAPPDCAVYPVRSRLERQAVEARVDFVDEVVLDLRIERNALVLYAMQEKILD